MFGVPSHYQQLAVDPKLQNKDLSFIRNYAAGGDAIARGAEQTVNDFLAAHNVEFPIAKGYGMTEVSSAATAAAAGTTSPAAWVCRWSARWCPSLSRAPTQSCPSASGVSCASPAPAL